MFYHDKYMINMKTHVEVFVIILLIISGVLVVFLNLPSQNKISDWQELSNTKSLANTPWPMFHHDLRHTGLSPYDTSDNPGKLRWKFKTEYYVLSSSPAIGSNGIIYIGSADHYLYAINPNGTLKWKFQTGYELYSSPAIDSDGTIYVGSDDHYLYAINPDGTLKWKFHTGDAVFSSPAIGNDGTIYVGSTDHYLYAINPDGTLKWKFQTGYYVSSSPAIDSDGTIYVGSNDYYLYAINPDGTLKWDFQTGDGVPSSPAIGGDGTIYVGSEDNYIYAINPDGTLKWRFRTGDWVLSSPAIGKDGTIYVHSNDSYLYAINPDGTLKWKFQMGYCAFSFSSPAIGSDGTIYVGSDDDYLYAINPDGTLKWKFQTRDHVFSSPAIGSDGTIYVGSLDGYLYAIGTVPPSPPQNLTASRGDGYVILRWKPPLNNGGASVTEYRVYRDGNLIGSVSGRKLQYNDTQVNMKETHTYYVTAVNTAGESNRSNEVSVSWGVPEPPQTLQAERGVGYVFLTWESPKDDGGASITSYRIYRNGEIICEVDGNTQHYNDTSVNINESYTYYVTAINGVGESSSSNEVNVSWHASAPQNLKAKPKDGYMLLQWESPADDGGMHIIEYRIYRKEGNKWILVGETQSTEYRIPAPKADLFGGETEYKVVAVNFVGEGEPAYVSIQKPIAYNQWIIIIFILVITIVIYFGMKRYSWKRSEYEGGYEETPKDPLIKELEYIGNPQLNELIMENGEISREKLIENWEEVDRIIAEEMEGSSEWRKERILSLRRELKKRTK